MQVSTLLLPELAFYKVTSHWNFISKQEGKDYLCNEFSELFVFRRRELRRDKEGSLLWVYLQSGLPLLWPCCLPCIGSKAAALRKTVSSWSELGIVADLHFCFFFQIESRKRLARTVLVFVCLFAFCWLPTHIIYLYRSYHYSEVDTSVLHFISSICARILAFTNSCVNPFALYLLSKSFRKQFNNQLFCCRARLLIRSQSMARSTTRMTSLKSTNHSLATFSLINGNHGCHEGCA